MSDAEPVRELLTLLPAAAPGQSYAMAEVDGEFRRFDLEEAWANVVQCKDTCCLLGVPVYLDRDHNFRSRMVELERLYFVPEQAILVEGVWTKEGMLHRPEFQGVSHSCIRHSTKYPPTDKMLEADKRQWEELEKNFEAGGSLLGTLGCVCIKHPPMFKGTWRRFTLDGPSDPLALSVEFNAPRILHSDCLIITPTNNKPTTE